MNICLLSSSAFHPTLGGVERFSWLMTGQLLRRGHQCVCVSRAEPEHSVQLACPVLQVQGQGEPFVSSLQTVMEQYSIEVLWLQSLEEQLVADASEACSRTGAKLVCQLHVEPASKLKGYRDCLAQARYHACHGRAIGDFVYFLARYPLGVFLNAWRVRRLFRRIYHSADCLVLLSERYKGEFVRIAGLHDGGAKLTAIPNPLTQEVETPCGDKLKELLYVGRLPWQHKRVDRLLRIWEMVQDEFPDWHFTIVGGGNEQETYQELADELKLKRVYFAGTQNPAPYYARSSLFCLSSSFEGYPLVLKEAQAYGCIPVCFASFAAAYDIIENGQTGYLIPPFDLRAYADCLRMLMRAPEKRSSLARLAAESAGRYTTAEAALQWEQLFHSLIVER